VKLPAYYTFTTHSPLSAKQSILLFIYKQILILSMNGISLEKIPQRLTRRRRVREHNLSRWNIDSDLRSGLRIGDWWL
jgi:hypothetical protein